MAISSIGRTEQQVASRYSDTTRRTGGTSVKPPVIDPKALEAIRATYVKAQPQGVTMANIGGGLAGGITYAQPPPTYQPAPQGGGGGGGGGGGAGAGIVPVGDTGGETLADIIEQLGLKDVSEAQLAAQLEAIAAQLGVNTAELLAQRDLLQDPVTGEPGPLVVQALTDITRQYEANRRDAISNVLQRGIFRSGIAAQNLGRVERTRTEGEANVAADTAAKLESIQNQITQFEQQAKAEKAKAQADWEMEQLQIALQQKLAGV